MIRPIRSSDLTYAKFPMTVWSKEKDKFEKRVLLNQINDSFSELSKLTLYNVDMFSFKGRLDATTKLSRGYVEKFYFIKDGKNGAM